MELKKGMIVEHILLKLCTIEVIHNNYIVFTSSRRWHKMLKSQFLPYIKPLLDKKGNVVYRTK